jgi:hypothetical protein
LIRVERLSLPVLAALLVVGSTPAGAQTIVNPTTATFTASSDQNSTTSSGAPMLSSYELEFYMPGATQPFQTVGLGKPTPDASNNIAVNFATLLSPVPPTGVIYSASVAAVGPGGRSSSALSVDTFSFTGGTPSCTFTVSPSSISLPSAGGTGSATVTAPSGCTWTATESASWLSITSGASGSGNGTVSYSATTNTATTAQNTTMTIAGKAIPVTEAAATCSYTVSPSSISLPSAGGTGSATVTAPSGCTWTATETASWLSITSGASGSGNGTVSYTATANTTASAQSTTMTVAGKAVPVTEAPPAAPSAPQGLKITPPGS